MSFCKLDVENDQWLTQASAEDWKNVIDECAFATFEATRWATPSEISFLLTDDAVMQQLNSQYRGQNKATNVLSFPLLSFSRPGMPSSEVMYCDEPDTRLSGVTRKKNTPQTPTKVCLLGDVVLSYSAILRELRTLKGPFMDRAFHLMTHGILHLIGYDHENDSEAFLMESVEAMILQKFGISDPYDSDP
ncbi:MAG: rRNA maturation RNase YbeY [Holosporales bacterium]|jgi:probable rRNA maturation factor|nr:rRNA maturation RNase YbeY [Holosporales bacterium]